MSTTADVSQWIEHLTVFDERIVAAVSGAAEIEMHAGLDLALDVVHVETGSLRSTGRIETPEITPLSIEIAAVFGGEQGIEKFVDYAGFEEGYHPYLTPSMERALVDGASAIVIGFEAAAVL